MNRILQIGDAGPCVRYLQGLLRERSDYTGAVDGVLGEGTSRALMRFQQQHGLQPTGRTEPVTWEVLTSGGVPATPPPAQRCRLLRLGAEGPDVALVQEQLTRLGFAVGVVDGIYGTLTENAVRQWQLAVGLPANGIIGRRAWERLGVHCQAVEPSGHRNLTPALKPGDQGRSVVLLQALLMADGFDPGAVDGVYGTLTTAAVTALQRSVGLPVTGSVGDEVWAALGLPLNEHSDASDPGARLRYGSRGPRVRELQVLLLEMGFDPGELDGIYGEQVREAVMQLQSSLNLPMTGKMGWAEWQALGVADGAPDRSPIPYPGPLVPNDRGSQVEELQRLLHAIGYDPGPMDGYYGPLTEAAVMLLQRCEGLPITGTVDAATWSTLA